MKKVLKYISIICWIGVIIITVLNILGVKP